MSGSIQHPITKGEQVSLKATESDIQRIIESKGYRKPDSVWVRDPCGKYGDRFKNGSKNPLRVDLEARSGSIIGLESTPVIVKTQTFKNHSSVAGDFNVSIHDSVSNTVENSWSESNSLSFNQSISYDVSFLGTGGGGETSFGYSHEWGSSHSNSKTVEVGSESGVSVRLEPGQEVVAELSASRGKLKIAVDYVATVLGTVLAYNGKDDSLYWYWSSRYTYKGIREIIEIDYYSNGEIVLRDPTTRKVLKSRPFQITPVDTGKKSTKKPTKGTTNQDSGSTRHAADIFKSTSTNKVDWGTSLKAQEAMKARLQDNLPNDASQKRVQQALTAAYDGKGKDSGKCIVDGTERQILHASSGNNEIGSLTIFHYFINKGATDGKEQMRIIAVGEHHTSDTYKIDKNLGQPQPPFQKNKVVTVDGSAT
ncbi:hypothetical protein AB0L06_30710 [Spirillospora sp. NPDC052269]